jgi:hypothetical protein
VPTIPPASAVSEGEPTLTTVRRFPAARLRAGSMPVLVLARMAAEGWVGRWAPFWRGPNGLRRPALPDDRPRSGMPRRDSCGARPDVPCTRGERATAGRLDHRPPPVPPDQARPSQCGGDSIPT